MIFAVAKEDLEKLGEAFLVCEEEGVKTRVLLNFFPQVISKVYLERLGSKPLLTFSATPEDESLLLKRGLDFVMALIALVVLSPLLLILAVLVKLTSRGPILFSQTRCGLGGRKFTLYKFRSMRADADLLREELEALNEVDGPVFKIRNDPRCTPIGRFMRKFSLDELPQLVNIIKGDMSFVGPRPPLPEEVEKYERWQRRRLRMQPGTDLSVGAGRAQQTQLPALDGAGSGIHRPLVNDARLEDYAEDDSHRSGGPRRELIPECRRVSLEQGPRFSIVPVQLFLDAFSSARSQFRAQALRVQQGQIFWAKSSGSSFRA